MQKFRQIVSVTLLAMIASPAAFAYSETCQPTSENEIAALFDRWNAALKSGNPSQVVANYAQKSILLATVSNKPRLTPEEKIDYFEHFLMKKPVGKIDFSNIEIDCNSAIDAGLYTFRLGDGTEVKARYTFTYKWNGKDWLITSHHSSVMPEK